MPKFLIEASLTAEGVRGFGVRAAPPVEKLSKPRLRAPGAT